MQVIYENFEQFVEFEPFYASVCHGCIQDLNTGKTLVDWNAVKHTARIEGDNLIIPLTDSIRTWFTWDAIMS